MRISAQNRILEFCKLHDLNVTEVSYARPGGSTKGFLISAKNSLDELVVWAHGAGNDAFYLMEPVILNVVMTRGCALFVFHLDGHGVGCDSVLDEDDCADAIVDAVNQAHQSFRQIGLPNKTHVVGFSLGGALAWQANNLGKLDAVDTMCLVGVPHRIRFHWKMFHEIGAVYDPQYIAEISRLGFFEALPAIGPFKRRRFPVRLSRREGGAGRHWKFVNRNYVSVVSKILETSAASACDHREGCDVTMIFGGRDHIAPLASQRLFQSKAPQVYFVRVPTATHLCLPLRVEVFDELARIWR